MLLVPPNHFYWPCHVLKLRNSLHSILKYMFVIDESKPSWWKDCVDWQAGCNLPLLHAAKKLKLQRFCRSLRYNKYIKSKIFSSIFWKYVLHCHPSAKAGTRSCWHMLIQLLLYETSFLRTRFRAASSGPYLTFGFEEAFKEGKIFISIFEIWKFYISIAIYESLGVHRYPWFQNPSINMARADPDKLTNMNWDYIT